MLHLPEYIYLEDKICLQIQSKLNKSLDFLQGDLIEKFKKKRFPINIWMNNNTSLFGEITYLIEGQNFFKDIRNLVRACLTKKEFDSILFNIIKSEFILKSGYSEKKILIKQIKSSKNTEKENVKKWKIPKKKLAKTINRIHKEKSNKFQNHELFIEKSYFKLPCIKPLLTLGGMMGKRNSGAMVIAFACICEGLTKKEAKIVGNYYYERTNKTDFSIYEVLKWINWIYTKSNVQWSCRTPKDIGECDKRFCWIVKDYYKKERIF